MNDFFADAKSGAGLNQALRGLFPVYQGNRSPISFECPEETFKAKTDEELICDFMKTEACQKLVLIEPLFKIELPEDEFPNLVANITYIDAKIALRKESQRKLSARRRFSEYIKERDNLPENSPDSRILESYFNWIFARQKEILGLSKDATQIEMMKAMTKYKLEGTMDYIPGSPAERARNLVLDQYRVRRSVELGIASGYADFQFIEDIDQFEKGVIWERFYGTHTPSLFEMYKLEEYISNKIFDLETNTRLGVSTGISFKLLMDRINWDDQLRKKIEECSFSP